MCRRRSSRRWRSSCSRASPPIRPPSASWPPSTCCWCVDNFEHVLRSRAVHRQAAGCLSRAHGAGHESGAARPARRGALPGVAAGAARARDARGRGRAGRRGRRRAVLRASARPRPRLRPRRLPTRRRSRRSAGASMGCRWPSSWRPRAAGCCHPTRSPNACDDALGALGSGARDAPARQQTLRATIDWSHELLSDAEKQCFARFAVFAGGATVQAAETITHAGLDTLDGLVAKSLLVRGQHAHAPTRLGMLETIRAYAAERFAAAADERRRPRAPLPLLPRAGPAPRNRSGALGRRRRSEHLARLDAEIDNLHAALEWAVGPAERRAGARDGGRARPVLADAKPLRRRGGLDRRRRWACRGADAHPALRVRLLCVKAHGPVAAGARSRATRGPGRRRRRSPARSAIP